MEIWFAHDNEVILNFGNLEITDLPLSFSMEMPALIYDMFLCYICNRCYSHRSYPVLRNADICAMCIVRICFTWCQSFRFSLSIKPILFGKHSTFGRCCRWFIVMQCYSVPYSYITHETCAELCLICTWR